MSVLHTIWETKVWLAFIGAGTYTFLKGVFPPDPQEDPDFYRWNVDANDGSSVNIFGFRKVLKQPTVLAQGMLSPSTARIVAMVFGAIFFLAGALGILHYLELPPFAPLRENWW